MGEIDIGAQINIEDLRRQLTERLAQLAMVASGLLIWLELLWWAILRGAFQLQLSHLPLPIVPLGLLAVLMVIGWVVHLVLGTRPALARNLLVWALTAVLLAAMVLLADPWLPFLGLALPFVTSLLMAGGGFVSAAVIAVATIELVHIEDRIFPVSEFVVALAVSAGVAWLTVRRLYIALEWAWTMKQEADQALELARDRQQELNRTVKSLDLTNSLLSRTQRALILAHKQADDARRMKEQFAANVSHELRTPLNMILGFSEVICLSSELYGDMEWSPLLRRDIYRIYQNARHLMEMIDDVLHLSRLEAVGFDLDKGPTRPEALLQETVDVIEDLFRDRAVRLEVEIAPDLPELEVDRTRMRQVLLNLLKNAVRFAEGGSVRLEVRREQKEVVFAVHDTGPGIPADQLPRIFEAFYQVDGSLGRRYGGTGLGLTISKHFVEAHDGRIWVESEEGVGSTFSFALPVPEDHVPISRLQAARPLELSPRLSAPPVLVVDADPAVAARIDRHLEQFDVVQVRDPAQLAERALQHRPHAIVLNAPPHAQDEVFSLSAPMIECSLPSQSWVANDLGVAACLTRPVTTEGLLREIERLGDIRSVLVVDYDLGFCQMVERMLQASGQGFDVRRAYSGAAALRMMRERRPDLLLLDEIMPELAGLDVLEKMRQVPELVDVPVILITVTSVVEDALAQQGGSMTIRHRDGLKPQEVLRCLSAVINALQPDYDEELAALEGAANTRIGQSVTSGVLDDAQRL
jgi:signal transduction histidine kinase/CheY-like chemotaxis protein